MTARPGPSRRSLWHCCAPSAQWETATRWTVSPTPPCTGEASASGESGSPWYRPNPDPHLPALSPETAPQIMANRAANRPFRVIRRISVRIGLARQADSGCVLAWRLQLQALFDSLWCVNPVNVGSIGEYIRQQREQAKIS